MLPLLVPFGWSRFLRCWLLLILIASSVYQASAQNIAHKYTPNQQWGYDQFQLRINQVVATSVPDGGYNITFNRMAPNGTTATQIIRFDVANGVCVTALPVALFGNQTNSVTALGNAAPATGTYTWSFVGGTRFGGGAPITVGAITGANVTFDVVDQPGRTAASVATLASGTYVFNSTLYLGQTAPNPCPPRDLTFAIDLGIEAAPHKSHNVALSLVINDGAPIEVVPPYIAKGSATLDISINVPNVPGAFTYKWMFNGAIVASGMFGCGDEIPFNRVDELATVTAQALPDQDGDGDPDVTDPDIDGDNIPNDKEGDIITTPEPGTNAGPGAPQGSEGNPIPQPGTTVGTGVGNGTGTPGENGNVNVLNVKDFQDAFKWAFENAGNNNGYFAAPGNGQTPYNGVGWTDPAPGELSTAGIDAAKGALEDAEEAGELLKGDASAVVTAMASHKPNISGQPVPNGVWRFNLGNIGLQSFGQNYFDVDIRPFSSAVSTFRSICSWVLLVLAWFKFWNFFRSIVPA